MKGSKGSPEGILEDEKSDINLKQDYKILFRLFKYIGKYKWGVIAAFLMITTLSFFELAAPYIMKKAIDDGILKSNKDVLIKMSLLYLFTFLIMFPIRYTQRYKVENIGQNIMQDLVMDLFSKFQRLSLSFFNKHPVGRLVTRVTSDIQSLRDFFTMGVVALFYDVFLMIAVIITMFVMNWKLSLVTLMWVPFIVVVSSIFRTFMRKAYDEVRVKIASLISYLNENITGIKVIQLFNAQKESMEHFKFLSNDYLKSWLKSVKYMSYFFPFISLMGGVMTLSVLKYGGDQVLSDVLTLGSLVAFIQYVNLIIQPLNRIGERYNVFLAAIPAAQKVFTMMDCDEMIAIPENPVPLNELKNEVEFKNVSFSYIGDDEVLKNISFNIAQNEKIAIVGSTGSGKTTIINLLYHFYDIQKGEILIDGHNIKEYDIHELRRNFGLVQQEVFLFSGTILDNIRLGEETISPEQVKEAARLVNADKFIEKLPNKYDTILGERGTGLSTGEKQLLAFARTVAMNPKIMLVLDEATSNIDTETERLIQDGLNHLLKDRTALIIAHRLSTIQKADRIIVIHKGEVREIGTHQELMHQQGLYYKLYQLQFSMLAS